MPVAEVKQWTVKGVEDETRNAFILAARTANLSMGEWLNRYGQALVQAFMDGRNPALPADGNAVVLAGHTKGNGNASGHSEPELRELLQAARDLTPPDSDTKVMRTARAVVQDRLARYLAPTSRESAARTDEAP